MNKAIMLILLVLCSQALAGQEKEEDPLARNSISVEVGGNAVFGIDLSYERIFYKKEKLKFIAGAGLGIAAVPFYGTDLLLLSRAGLLVGRKHHLETGLGLTLYLSETYPLVPVRIGYRYQKPGGGFLFSAFFLPLFEPGYQEPYGFSLDPQFLAGLSAGYAF